MLNQIALCLTLLMTSTISFGKTQQEIIENAKKFTVLVTQEGLLGSGRGSGVLLDETHVLTCFHMLATPQDELFVYTYPFGRVYKARPDVVDQKNDLAVLVLESSATVRVKPVIQTKVTVGENIYVIGNALGGMHLQVRKGIISGKERSYLLTDAMGQHGDSGGPWINEKGEIVAITSWGFDGIPGIMGGIAGKDVYKFTDYYFHPEKLMKRLMEMLFGVNVSTGTK